MYIHVHAYIHTHIHIYFQYSLVFKHTLGYKRTYMCMLLNSYLTTGIKHCLLSACANNTCLLKTHVHCN